MTSAGSVRQVDIDTVTKIAITQVGEWMSGAKAHAVALKAQPSAGHA